MLALNPNTNPNALVKAESARIGGVVDDLGNMLRQTSDDIAQGRDLYQLITREVIEPLNRTGLADVAQSRSFKQMVNVIADPDNARPAEVSAALGRMAEESPQAVSRFVRVYVENELGKALKDNVAGPRSNVGAFFRNAVAGDPRKRANFNAMLTEAANANGTDPDDYIRGWDHILQVLERTGRILAAGS